MVVCFHTASELLLVLVTMSVQACQVVVGALRRVSGEFKDRPLWRDVGWVARVYKAR